MIDVSLQLGSAVLCVQEHLHQRKSICAVKGAARRIKKVEPLAKKFIQRESLLCVPECLNQRPTLTPRRKSQCALNQPIGWLNQHRSRCDVWLVAINHFEQNRAEQLPLDQRDVDVIGNSQVELQLDAETSLTESQISRRELGQV